MGAEAAIGGDFGAGAGAGGATGSATGAVSAGTSATGSAARRRRLTPPVSAAGAGSALTSAAGAVAPRRRRVAAGGAATRARFSRSQRARMRATWSSLNGLKWLRTGTSIWRRRLMTSSLDTPNSPARSCTRSLLKPALPYPHGRPALDSGSMPECPLPDHYLQFQSQPLSHVPPRLPARRRRVPEQPRSRAPSAEAELYPNCCLKRLSPQ